jgi:hypothetical protein
MRSSFAVHRLIQAMKSDLGDLLHDRPDHFGVNALRIIWHSCPSIRQIENPGRFPVIPPEELLSRFQARLHYPPTLPEEPVIESTAPSPDSPPTPFIIPIWDVRNALSPPDLIIPQIYPFPAIAFPSRFFPWDGRFEYVDLFGSSDTSDEQPYAWMAVEQASTGGVGFNVDALIEIREEEDKSYPHCSYHEGTDEATEQVNLNCD